MAETTVEWADFTFNPWIGCQRVSPGCEHCYAESYAKRVGHGSTKPALWGPEAERRVTSGANWRQPLRWNNQSAIAMDHGAMDRPVRVFCASLADVFEDRPELAEPRSRLFGLIKATRHLDWLLLTKRPENAERLWRAAQEAFERTDDPWGETWRPNTWLGTTVEDQRRADERIPHLLAVPAAVRFLSCEPLLGPVDLRRWLICSTCGGCGAVTQEHDYASETIGCHDCMGERSPINWVIAGGESGPGARPTHPAWARSLRDQCAEAGVPFLFKQWGEWAPAVDVPHEMQRWGKKAAGRELDGRTWDEFPEVRR